MTVAKLITHLSQSFFIDQPTFITKLDLFFSSKDTSIPVKLNIRKNKEGRPTNEILNFSQILINSDNVNSIQSLTESNSNLQKMLQNNGMNLNNFNFNGNNNKGSNKDKKNNEGPKNDNILINKKDNNNDDDSFISNKIIYAKA